MMRLEDRDPACELGTCEDDATDEVESPYPPVSASQHVANMTTFSGFTAVQVGNARQTKQGGAL